MSNWRCPKCGSTLFKIVEELGEDKIVVCYRTKKCGFVAGDLR